MAHPFLDLAIGALRGYTAGRELAAQRRLAEEERARQEEERARRRELEELERAVQLGRLAETGAEIVPQPGSGSPASGLPFLETALSLGGRQVRVRLRPGAAQREQEAQQRAAFQELQRRQPKRYPSFVPGFDYQKQLAEELEEERLGLRPKTAEQREDLERRRALAEDKAFNLLNEGRSFDEVLHELNADPQTRGLLNVASLRRLYGEVQQLGGLRDRESRVRQRLGKPPVGAVIPVDIEQAIVEALAAGASGDDVVNELPEGELKDAVTRWLGRAGFVKR